MAGRLLAAIRHAERSFDAYLDGHCGRLGLSAADGRFVAYLEERGPCPIGELQGILGYKPSTLTTVVDRLVEQRLVVRKPNPADRRSVLLVLTGPGRAMAERVGTLIETVERQVLRATTAEERAGFERVLKAMAEAARASAAPLPR